MERKLWRIGRGLLAKLLICRRLPPAGPLGPNFVGSRIFFSDAPAVEAPSEKPMIFG